jgi:alpha-amylase
LFQDDDDPQGEHSVVFVDTHGSQRWNDDANDLLNHLNPKLYQIASAFILAHPIQLKRVMSSYQFDNIDAGPPTTPPGSIAEGAECKDGWVCEHRWPAISNMVKVSKLANFSSS